MVQTSTAILVMKTSFEIPAAKHDVRRSGVAQQVLVQTIMAYGFCYASTWQARQITLLDMCQGLECDENGKDCGKQT